MAPNPEDIAKNVERTKEVVREVIRAGQKVPDILGTVKNVAPPIAVADTVTGMSLTSAAIPLLSAALAIIVIGGIGYGVYLAAKTGDPNRAVDPLSDTNRITPATATPSQPASPLEQPPVASDPRYEVQRSQGTATAGNDGYSCETARAGIAHFTRLVAGAAGQIDYYESDSAIGLIGASAAAAHVRSNTEYKRSMEQEVARWKVELSRCRQD